MRRKSLDFKSNIYQHGSRAEHEAWGPVEPSDMTENRTSEDEEEKQAQKLRWIFERKRLDCHEHQKAEKHEAETEDPNIGEDRNRAEAGANTNKNSTQLISILCRYLSSRWKLEKSYETGFCPRLGSGRGFLTSTGIHDYLDEAQNSAMAGGQCAHWLRGGESLNN